MGSVSGERLLPCLWPEDTTGGGSALTDAYTVSSGGRSRRPEFTLDIQEQTEATGHTWWSGSYCLSLANKVTRRGTRIPKLPHVVF